MSVSGKLFLISVVLIAVVGLVSAFVMESQLQSWLRSQLLRELKSQVRSARFVLAQDRKKPTPRSWSQLAHRLGTTFQSRVTLIREDGRVLGDSRLPYTSLVHLDNHGKRPEILQSLRQSFGMASRYSRTLKMNMLYVAARVSPHQTKQGFVRVAMPLTHVEGAVRTTRWLLLIAGAVGLFVAIFMSGLSSHLFSRHLLDVVRNEDRRQDGIMSEEEKVMGSLNSMEGKLEEMVSALAAERNRFEAVLESMNAAVIAFDENEKVTLVNRFGLNLLDMEKPPVNQELRQIISARELHDLINRALRGETKTTEFVFHGPPRRRLLARATPLQPSGGVVVIQDITELRRLETIRRDFVANVSHELRTPVSIIRANSETLLDGALEDPEHARFFLKAILRHAERLSSLISDLLDISRIEANQYKLEIKPVVLIYRISQVLDSVRSKADLKRLSMTHDIDPSFRVEADALALEQVLINFFDNAIKYNPEGGKIEVTAIQEDGMIRVEVSDDGPGIAPKHHARIFERFYRVDRGRSRDMGGTGLGLAIVKNLTEAMGGQVGLKKSEYGGSCFWFSLPDSDNTPSYTPSVNAEELEKKSEGESDAEQP
jgi:two-component system phosphate regulon sensor histidine kinase PhoR